MILLEESLKLKKKKNRFCWFFKKEKKGLTCGGKVVKKKV